MPQVNWGEFVSLEYWLEGVAGRRGADDPQSLIIQADSWFFWLYLWIFVFFVVLAILLKASQAFLDPRHPLQRQIPVWSANLALMGVFGFCWFFFRQINAYMLNSRLWLLVGLLWLLGFLGWVVRYFWHFFPLEWATYQKVRLTAKE